MSRFDDALLDQLRMQTDPDADEMAAHYLERPASDMFKGALGARYAGTDMIDPHVRGMAQGGPTASELG